MVNCRLAFSGVELSRTQCLVLGRPGSGCSTFLKSIANRRKDYLQVEGSVLYAGITAEEMGSLYGGEVVYNQEGESATSLSLESPLNACAMQMMLICPR